MLEELLPNEVVAVETREDTMDVVLFPTEEVIVRRAVEKRRRESRLSAPAHAGHSRVLTCRPFPSPVVSAASRNGPPASFGSITHCESYRACALARSHEIATVGIDAEPNAPLPDGVLEPIART